MSRIPAAPAPEISPLSWHAPAHHPSSSRRNLLKLADTRATDGKESLLSWIARQLASASPPLPVLAEEVPAVASPRLRIAVDEAAGALEALSAGLTAVAAELQRNSGGNDSRPASASGDASNSAGAAGAAGDGAGSASSALHRVATDLESRLAAAKALLQRCREGFAQLAAYYGESAAALSSEQELWLQIQPFVDRFSAAQRAVAAERKAEEERLRRQANSGPPGSAPPRVSKGLFPSPAWEGRDASQPPAPTNGSAPAAGGANQADAQQQPSAASLASPVSEPPARAPSRQLTFSSPPPRKAETAAAPAAAGGTAAASNGAAGSRVQQLLQQADVSSNDE